MLKVDVTRDFELIGYGNIVRRENLPISVIAGMVVIDAGDLMAFLYLSTQSETVVLVLCNRSGVAMLSIIVGI